MALVPRKQIPQPCQCKDLKTSLILFNNNTVIFVNSGQCYMGNDTSNCYILH